jgi:regulator of protease activity HflC (stomatin/prohibitin superfamily)
MLEIIGQFLQAILGIIPRLVIIRTTHGGVKFRRGKKALAMRPGLHIYWPVVTQVEVVPVARQTVSLPSQVLTTQDDKSIMVAGSVVYTINDVILAYGGVNYDVPTTLDDVARAAIVELITSKTLEQLKGCKTEINADFTLLCRKRLKAYGVGVRSAYFTDFAQCRVYRLVGNIPH